MAFLAGFFLLLAASTILAPPAGLQGAPTPGAPTPGHGAGSSVSASSVASYGFLLAACAVGARATGLQLAARAAPTGAHRALAGWLLAAFAVSARAAGLLASRGPHRAIAGWLLAVFAVPAHAAGLLASRGALGAVAGWFLAVFTVPARAAGLLATRGAHRAVAGWLLAVFTVPARATGLLASRGAHRAVAGWFLAVFTVPARTTGLLTSRGAHRAVAGWLLAAFAVPARAAGLLASRGAHRKVLGYIFLTFLACSAPARLVVGIDVDPYADEGVMHAISTALGADRSLGWTKETSPCVDRWTGVSCNREGRVSAIVARNARLNGTLAQEIGSLPALRKLDLRDNCITGDVPNALFIYIASLRLDGNLFDSIPVSFLYGTRDLRIFTIGNNPKLRKWELPTDPSRLVLLKVYIADNAHLSGTLSAFLASSDFPALNVLSLAHNYLEGEVPATFAVPTLTHLDLSYNLLSGPVDFLANLTGLRVLRLRGNTFTGPLPDFSNHPNLRVVDLADNRLTGVVPASLVRLAKLHTIRIKDNQFQGAIPVFASHVHNDIAEAATSGSFCRPDAGPCDGRVDSFIAIAGAFRFPVTFASSWKGNNPCDGWLGVHCDRNGEITGINFSRYGLNGTLHPAFGDFRKLVILMLASNNISGAVPSSIARLPFLKILDISDNALEGTMPQFPRSVTIWAEGNKNLTVAGAYRLCTSDAVRRFVAAAAAGVLALA